MRGSNIIDVTYDKKEIYQAIHKAFFDESFRKECRNSINPYGIGGAGELIAEIIDSIEINDISRIKKNDNIEIDMINNKSVLC